jgi:peptidoglycan hydrolase CwlO-like protein
MKATIERLHNKIESLLANYQQLKEELKVSNQKFDILSKQLDEHNQTIQQLNEKNKVLKLSSSIQGEQGDNKAAKQKINELVREIDKCIALLNK